MGKNFSIIKKVDIDKLDFEISKYIRINNERNPYIFMSEETVEAIENHFNPAGFFTTNAKDNKGYCGLYTGYKIFIDNTKKYGDVEIR